MKPQGPAEEPPTGFLSLVNALQTLFVQSGVVLAGPERPKPDEGISSAGSAALCQMARKAWARARIEGAPDGG